MKYNHREDRMLRRTVRHTMPYDSRKKIQGNFVVNNIVSKFSRGLGSYGDTSKNYSRFIKPATIDRQLLDKYYISSHLYPRDLLTELGDTNKTKNWLPAILLVMAIFFLFKS